MPLPFPHGDGPGQIANGHNYDVNDTPGYVGGRFIGFGEFATSAITNRAAWALSTNIDYIYQKYASAIAVPQVDKFTATGASRYHLSTLVFCGDGVTYPVMASEGLMLLFSVLDDQYNTLTDGLGNEVRVSSVMDTTDTSSVYGTSFAQSPWVHFCTVNPETGAVVQATYVIPAPQVVRLVYGVQSSLEFLPVDALIRYKVMSGEEVPAGVLLLDGSRSMLGDLDMGGNNILAGPSISLTDPASSNLFTMDVGVGGTTLTTHVSGVGDATLVSDPNSGVGLSSLESFDLGSAINPWGTIWAYDLNIAGHYTPLLTVDYSFMEDFGVRFPPSYYPDLPGGAVVGTWLQVVGDTDSSMFKDMDVVLNRSTVLYLKAPTTPGAIGFNGPPLFISPTASLLKFSVGFALPVLSDTCGGDLYTVIAGFNPDTIATDTGAYFLIDESAVMYAVWKDDTGNFRTPISAVTVLPNVWYDCTISFNPTSVDFLVNGVIVFTTPFTVASRALLVSVPLRLTNLEGTTKSLWIDYAEIHTEGHQPRLHS
jgi:hypothetical protein